MKRNLFLALLACIPFLLCAQGSTEAQQAYRQTRLEHLLADPRKPVDSENLTGIRWFTPDEGFVVRCQVAWLEDAERVDIPTYSGMNKSFLPVAKLHFQLGGQAQTLTVFRYAAPPAMAGEIGPYFLPFKDATNGNETYEGGRYVDIPREALQGDSYMLDLNGAYNPLCAYADGFHCPIPPRENHLNFRVEAGEKTYAGPYKPRE